MKKAVLLATQNSLRFFINPFEYSMFNGIAEEIDGNILLISYLSDYAGIK
jgi:hypothetical protein